MKLFLSSLAISPEQHQPFMELVCKDQPEAITIALIENAADVYDESTKDWMYDNRRAIQEHGFVVNLVNLTEYRQKKQDVTDMLSKADVIWLGGGNTYYLRWILQDTGADELITNLIHAGTVYGGASAGAIIAGPTIDCFQAADEPEKAPKLILTGLGLVDSVVIPHWKSQAYGKIMEESRAQLQAIGYKTIELTDSQAMIFDNGTQTVIGV